VSIFFKNNGLDGIITDSIVNLIYLQSLVIFNDYSENDTNRNTIYNISEDINKLLTLRELVITNVNWSQKLITFFKFSNLEILDLSRNSLTGLLSSFYLEMPKLKHLNLSSNLLKGQLDSLMNLVYIEKVELQNNLLEGTIPILNNKNLQILDVRNNTLSGSFPVNV
jgi:hypothetical protein